MKYASRLIAVSPLLIPLSSPTLVIASDPVIEAPSTVNATYVEPSSTRMLLPDEKVGSLFNLNIENDFVLQRLTERVYWFQKNYYATTFYVGDNGVLLFDPLDGAGQSLKDAIGSVTDLPITAMVYSHNHVDHIGNAAHFSEGNPDLRIIASEATADQQAFLNSSHPKATETVSWPSGSFDFEGLSVELHGFERATHSEDHGIWLLKDENVAHLPDLINPDQPPFWEFAGSETFMYYETNMEQLADLEWTFLTGGHGNIGAKEDIEFYRVFLNDLKQAVGNAMGSIAWGEGVDVSKVNAHTVYLSTWISDIGKQATDTLRPKYGSYYGFEAATPANAEMVVLTLFDYR